ncbi:EF-hand domain-containing protein [Thalassoglobus sp. JC818]|uniref:EF-hand domain-containing protein n=1 Tax=Thalassoglobus sp. JC818 TaxID=3232136 RepID=UPI00345883A5
MSQLRLALLSLVFVGIATSLYAAEEKKADAKKADPEKVFKRLDKNADGSLTWEEFKVRPSKTEKTAEETKKQETRLKTLFARMDQDKDKKVTLEEYKKPAPAKKKKKAAAE